MRIRRLDLKAYGPFTERSIGFDSLEPGLHIVFGANEAGKSSSLRALKALLYGFPERTTDNFQHANDQLLVGGCLQQEDGREITFVRRKKRKADILTADGNPLDAAALASFLPADELALFESLYGIDHETLVRGGEDILAQKGEVGQALFAAGAGISSLRRIMDSLDAEADELFKSRGTRQQINQALKEYRELKKTLKLISLPSGKWQEHRQRLREAEDEQARLEEQKRHKDAELRRLDRLNRAIPQLAGLDNLQQQLRALGEVVLLPADFAEQLRLVEQHLRETRLQHEKDLARLAKLQTRRKSIPHNPALLELAEAIEDLHQRIGEYRKGQQDRIRLDGMRISSRRDAGALLRQVRPDLRLEDAEPLRPMAGRRRLIQELGVQYESISQQLSRGRKQNRAAEIELAEIAAALEILPENANSDLLDQALKLARKAGEIDGQIKTAQREISQGKALCLSELKKAGLWSGELARLQELPLPRPETVRIFIGRFAELEQDLKQLRKDHRKAMEELATARAEHGEAIRGEIPSEQDLARLRHKRQQGWQLLRRQWLQREDIGLEADQYEPDRPLDLAYEKYVAMADHTADRLRREADRVAKTAALRARIEGLETIIRDLAGIVRQGEKQQEELAAQWLAEWQPLAITPLSPLEMDGWLGEMETIRFKAGEILAREREVETREKMRQHHRGELAAQLLLLGAEHEFAGNELAPVMVFAESLLETLARDRAEREKLAAGQSRAEKSLFEARQECEQAETALAEWEIKRDSVLAGLGCKERLMPAEALEMIEILASCFSKLDTAEDLQKRIDGIDRDGRKFTDDVRLILAQAALELTDLPPEQAALKLHAMSAAARQDNELLKRLDEEADLLGREIEGAEKTLRSLDCQMAELLATARCERVADLAGVMEKSREYQRLQERISDAEASLATICEGIPFAEMKAQAGAVIVDELPGHISSLRREIEEELYPRIKEVARKTGEENRELQLMDGSAAAAEAAEKMERVGARIRRLVDSYTRLKLAGMVLKREIERYREEHQDPVLKIASRYFADLTRGSFAGLRTDVDDRGEPVLVGLRPGDTRVPVQGMSSGTRDQLYLALRLATLERRLEANDPMPFIVDDILINFDDERSRATLQALAGLAAKNQIILFTHHRQIVDQAMQLNSTGSIHIHELGPLPRL